MVLGFAIFPNFDKFMQNWGNTFDNLNICISKLHRGRAAVVLGRVPCTRVLWPDRPFQTSLIDFEYSNLAPIQSNKLLDQLEVFLLANIFEEIIFQPTKLPKRGGYGSV